MTKMAKMRPGPIFRHLRSENVSELASDQYDKLWEVMRRLGYRDFRSRQQGLITLKFLAGENVFGVLPTSGGKSFTFQTVARLTDGLTIVISPLIALMKDQVAKHRDGASLYFNSDLSPWLKREVKRRIRDGMVRLLYISPERLKSSEFKELLITSRQRVRRFVIDEAHCVVEWGYSFRVKYLHIAKEIESFEAQLPEGERIPVLLLTATASPWLQRETAKNLRVHIRPSNYIVQEDGADRPELCVNLHFAASDKSKITWLAKQLRKGGRFYGKRGIIFSAFADGGEGLGAMNAPSICKALQEHGIKRVGMYHGGMGIDARRAAQTDFQTKKLRVLVATKAFGMGIDMPKLGFVVHFYPPLSLEEYWQEAGRGGRGLNVRRGQYCQCVVLHKPSDYKVLQGFPNLATFAKILSTFTVAAQGVISLEESAVKPKGKLRRLLDRLHSMKVLRRMPPQRVAGVVLERWKLRQPAGGVVKHIEKLIALEGLNTRQTRRLRNTLWIRAARRGMVVRVERGANGMPALGYYDTELNWLTDPDLAALDMVDDKYVKGVGYSCFRIQKETLSPKAMKGLAKKINSYRRRGYAKLDYVFNRLLKAKQGQAKQVILDYLASKGEPA